MIREILTFGAVALGGGYLVKRYWDKKKATERYESEIVAIRRFCRFKSLRLETHKILANLAEKISALGDFGDSLELPKSYPAHNEKFDLCDFIALDENEANEVARILSILGFLESMICEMLKVKERWLDEIAQSLGKSCESSESDSLESSGKSLSAQTKSEIVELVEIMKAIHTLISRNFTSEHYDKLVEAQELIVALKSHPSESIANQN